MKKNNHGHVVTIASVAGIFSPPGQVAYNMSKFAAFAFDEGLRFELAKEKSKVQTTCICPYFINTGMFEGAKTKFPILFPILDQHWIAKRIVDAIRQEERLLVTPWGCELVWFFRFLMPTKFFDWVNVQLGVNETV